MESRKEFIQDILLAIAYLALAVCAGWRTYIYFVPDGGGRVITAFYLFIFLTALVRAIWFFIPSDVLEEEYTPKPTVAFESEGWQGVFISELLLGVGNIFLYAVFVLIVCYWSYMIRKVNIDSTETTSLLSSQQAFARYPRELKPYRGPMETFAFMMLFVVLIQLINFTLYLCQVYNSEAMILYDAIAYSIMSLATLIGLTIFSSRVRTVLATMGIINNNSARPQIRRILAITIAANVFFILRVIVETCLAVGLLLLAIENKSFHVVVSTVYWDVYINTKHWAEVIVLALELIISTTIKHSAKASTRHPHGNKSSAKHKYTAVGASEMHSLNRTADNNVIGV